MWVGYALLMLGVMLHIALADLAFTVEPRLISGDFKGRRIRPWFGLLVVLLLVAGLAFVGQTAVWLIREATLHREVVS